MATVNTARQIPDDRHQRTAATGFATAEGTRRFAARCAPRFAGDFYRELGAEILVSSIGMGTYLGACDDEDDTRYVAILSEGLARGVNVLDTGINYRCQRSERAVGRAIHQAIGAGSASRDEIVVCTKGGYVPLEGAPPKSRQEYRAYLANEYFDPGVMSAKDVVAGHCLKPRFLADQIARSRRNLGVSCIDVFYLHNPEQQLDFLGPAEFLDAIRAAFTELELQVQTGAIAVYGCATWNGLRVFAANRSHLSLADLMRIAHEVGGADNHFRVLQLPVNLAMTEAVRAPTQQHDGKNLSALGLAAQLGVAVVASASLMQSQLASGLPAEVRAAFPALSTDAQRAIAFVRSLPVSTALVGMKTQSHLDENLAAAPPITLS